MVTKKDIRLAKQIRSYRRKLKITQAQLAEKVNVTEKYIQYIENCRRTPSLKLIYRIARVLGVDAKDLFS